MATPDLTLSPGDILRGVVERMDAVDDVCVVDTAAHGLVYVPLVDLDEAKLERLAQGMSVCVQILSTDRVRSRTLGSLTIEFSGRLSVLVLDGTSIAAEGNESSVDVVVSKKLPGIRRIELAKRMEESVADTSTGISSMLGAVSGPVRIVLRSAADTAAWEQVVSAVVVQMTEAAAFTVLAKASGTPALLMAEKMDADGEALIALGNAGTFGGSAAALDGRRLSLSAGSQIVFEKTRGVWAVSVGAAEEQGVDASAVSLAQTIQDAARLIVEAADEYDAHGVFVVTLPDGGTSAEQDVKDAFAVATGRDDMGVCAVSNGYVVLFER